MSGQNVKSPLSTAVAVSAARKAVDQQLSSISSVGERIAELRSKVRDLRRESEAISEARSARNLAATLADEPLPADDGVETRRLKSIVSEVAAAEAAVPVMESKRAELERDLPRLQRELADAFVRWKAGQVRNALASSRRILGTLQSPLAELTALEATQREVLGGAFTVSRALDDEEIREALMSTGTLVARLLGGIPERLLPSELATDELTAATDAAKNSHLEVIR